MQGSFFSPGLNLKKEAEIYKETAQVMERLVQYNY